MTTDDGLLDEAYERLHARGPEFDGWLSNHGPMAVDALLRLGRGTDVRRWVVSYERRLEALPGARWAITAQDWRECLGDPSRLGDWLAFSIQQVHEEPWQQVLARWWPRLLPGAVASSTHGLIRTGHAVRALRDEVTRPRLDELGQALGYWAARWQPLPGGGTASGALDAGAALDALPPAGAGVGGGARTRLAALGADPAWVSALAGHRRPASAADVPGALDDLTDAAVSRYPRWAVANPVMLVHTATAPRAVALVLPSLPMDLWRASYDGAWAVTAAITAAYRPVSSAAVRSPDERSDAALDVPELLSRNDDEHVVKFLEVAVESQRRANPDAATAARRAVSLIGETG